MGYVYFTDDQKQRANAVDLEDFLTRQGEKLLRSGREKRLTSDHSITVRGNEWYDHAAEKGGCAIDFVQMFYGRSFPDAVTMLLNGEQGQASAPANSGSRNRPDHSYCRRQTMICGACMRTSPGHGALIGKWFPHLPE